MVAKVTVGSVYERLGVKSVINGHHWRTVLGGSVMPQEVLDAMVDSASYFVDVDDLNRRAGEYIAGLAGAEAGMVTAGCAAAQVLQAAACIAGQDEEKMLRLPDTTGMRNEIIIQKLQRNKYDAAFRGAGGKLVEIGSESDATIDDLESAIGPNTAAVAYVWVMRFTGLGLEEVIETAHARGVPVILDAAAELPPVDNLSRFISMGADMVAFSGGKGVRGPQSTGILVGRRDLMEAAMEHARSGKTTATVGRPMKVCKEEIVGLVAALDLFVKTDHEAEWAEWRARSDVVLDGLRSVSGITTIVNEGPEFPGPNAPTATIVLDESWQGPSPQEVVQTMLEGDPPIYIGDGPEPNVLWVAPVTLQDGEAEIVSERLRDALGG